MVMARARGDLDQQAELCGVLHSSPKLSHFFGTFRSRPAFNAPASIDRRIDHERRRAGARPSRTSPDQSNERVLSRSVLMKRFLIGIAIFALASCLSSSIATAQPKLVVKPLAQKKVTELPSGPLFWRIENFPGLAQAQAAAGPWSLVAESAGKVWLFTLGPAGGSTAGGTKVTEVGPLPKVVAKEYLLRINEGSGPPGSITAAHTHPGSEAFYVLAGETSSHSSHGVMRIGVGQSAPGHGADMPMRVSSSGSTDLLSLVMFVVDAARPFSSPATLP
jgi:hypothetical protein